MKLVLEIVPHSDEDLVLHRVLESFPATLGRAFHNDVILSDPHVNPHHLRIDRHGDGWNVTDLGSANGLFVNNAPQRSASAALKSGDTLRIGQTEIRFYAPDHPVADALPLQKFHPLLSWLPHPASAWALFACSIAVMQGWAFLEVWTDQPGMVVAAASAAAIGIVMAWAAPWSVAGRLLSHRGGFRNHVLVMSVYMIVAVIAWYIKAYVDFLANENWLADLISYSINFTLLAVLVYTSLTLASRMNSRRRIVAAASVSLGITLGAFALSLISMKNFNQLPLYAATLRPHLSWMAPAETPDTFMEGNARLFSSKEFEKSPAP